MRFFSKKRIESFENVTLHTSNMRHASEYEIIMKDGKAEVSQYGIRHTQEEDGRILEKRAVCDEGTALKLLNDCKLLCWDGFHGKHPRGVKDGTMFRLKATVNGKNRYTPTARRISQGITAISKTGFIKY